MFLVEMIQLCMVYLQGRLAERPTYRVRNALAQCRFPRTGGGCPMVGNKLISKPADGPHSTAIYLLKEDNLHIQTSK